MDATELKLFKISNGALRGDDLPKRLKIFAWGANETIDGQFTAGTKTAQLMAANQRKLGYERVAIDFDHCTVSGTTANKELTAAGQPPLIFGYGRVHVVAGDGIYLEDVTWTPLGVQHARNFEDLSPAIKDDAGEVVLVHSVALTPNGKVHGLQFFSTSNPQKAPMKIDDMSKPLTGVQLACLLGLAATASAEDLTTRLGSLTALSASIEIKDGKIQKLPGLIADGKLLVLSSTDAADLAKRLGVVEAAGNKGITTLSASIGGVVKTFSAEDLVGVLARVEGIETKLTAAANASLTAERDAEIKLFSAQGKVPKKEDGTAYSAAELAVMDVGTLKVLRVNTPSTVPLSARSGLAHDTKAKTCKDEKGIVNLAALFEAEGTREA